MLGGIAALDVLKHKDEFEELRISNNIELCKALALILLVLNSLLLVVDLTVYLPFRDLNIAYFYLYLLHVAMAVFIVLWLALSKLGANLGNIVRDKHLYRALANATLYWGVLLGLNGLFISGQISAYIICVFGVSAVLYISPHEALITYFLSLAAFIAGVVYFVADINIMASHIVNTAIAVIISFAVSRFRFICFLKEARRAKELEASSAKIEQAYYELEESNIKLTQEIKERQLAEEKIAHLIYYDALTGIFNRKKLMEDINLLLINDSESFAVLFIDLDKFKSINDRYGHEAGDIVLKSVALRLKGLIGENDIISRIGGDEFVIILRDLESAKHAEDVAQAIVEEMSTVFSLNNRRLYIGASIGISIYPEHGTSADTLIGKADMAMYRVKDSGGCGYLKYSETS